MTKNVEQALGPALAALDAGEGEKARKMLLPLSRKPATRATASYFLGVLHHRQQQDDQALVWMQQAVRWEPRQPLFHRDLGVILKRLGRLNEAVAAFRQALTLLPDLVEVRCNLAETLRRMGHLDQALAEARLAVSQAPAMVQTWYQLGVCLMNAGQPAEAREAFRQVVVLEPDHFQARVNLAVACLELDDLGEALFHNQQAMRQDADHVVLRRNFAHTLRLAGRWNEAQALYQGILRQYPNDVETTLHSLTSLLYQPGVDAGSLFEAHRRFGRRFTRPGSPLVPPVRAAGEPLRVGYVSTNFCRHPVATNLQPLIAHHDRRQVRLHLYHDGDHEDDQTAWFRQQAEVWRVTVNLDDQALTEVMRQDGLHVLVVVAGHFDDNRLLLAGCRPAPVCVSYHDGATSGVPGMDYWLTDSVQHPPDTREQCTETLWRLPVFYVYPPPAADMPAIGPCPCGSQGRVTFGSFNNPAKISAPVVRLWSRIVNSVPGSRLLLRYRHFFADGALTEDWRHRFEQAGLDPGRVDFASEDLPEGHLGFYNQVDIALDPFPFAGATTTFQALTMGVPVVSLLGEGLSSRTAGSILTHAGLPALAVTCEEDYLARAVALAGDPDQLAAWRRDLRQQVSASPLCDGPAYARTVEEALTAMWQATQGK